MAGKYGSAEVNENTTIEELLEMFSILSMSRLYSENE
jgi:hypothetical protein